MKQILFTLGLCLSIGGIFGQKKVLSDQDYDIWNTLKSYLIADNGVWMSYESTPYRGDGFAVLMKTDSTNVKRFDRMYSMFFSVDNNTTSNNNRATFYAPNVCLNLCFN